MSHYQLSLEEQEYLSHYDIRQYDRPSLATDMAIYSIFAEEEKDNFRKLPKQELKVLLIQRANYPYKDYWALPGGFCRPSEDVFETARRELYEETNVRNAYLKLVGTFGEEGRDPRGWMISNTFLALIDAKSCVLRAGTDAWEARWFTVELVETQVKKEVNETGAHIETEYELILTHEESDVRLTAKITEYKEFKNYHETVRYEIKESHQIAFDHAKLILYTLLSLRDNVKKDSRLVFDLLPELFTLSQLQNAFELILEEKLLTANFRRKMADYCVETEQVVEGAGHRPAKLFKRNIEEFYR